MKSEIITSWNIFGLNFYQRIRIKEKDVKISKKRNEHFFVGLFPVVEKPKIKLERNSSSSKNEWKRIAGVVFYKAIFHLLFNDVIQLVEFQDKKKILFGLISFSNNGYYLKIKERQYLSDIFLNRIVVSIDDVEIEYKKKNDLHIIIKQIIDRYLGDGKNVNPEQLFVTELLWEYGRKYDWVNLISEKTFLSFSEKYSIKISDDKLVQLKKSFRFLNDDIIAEKKINPKASKFSTFLSNVLESDFNNRITSNNDIEDEY